MREIGKNSGSIQKIVFIVCLFVFISSNHPIRGNQGKIQYLINDSNQTGLDWVEMNPTVAPPARYHHEGQFVYDSESDRMILFSGDREAGTGWFIAINDTWAYDYNTNTWENMTNEQMRKNGRIYSGMAYDSESDRIIMFGGAEKKYMANSTKAGETWSYDYNTNTWTNLTTADGPSARGCHSMTYDEANDRIIIYGGLNPKLYHENLLFYQDTWAYDYNTNTWTNMSPPVNPGPLIQPGYAYDSESEKTIIFGGRNQSRSKSYPYNNLPAFSSNDTWVYSYSDNNWTKMTPANFPSKRAYGRMTYISDLDKVLLFGGILPDRFSDNFRLFSDTWIYDYNTNTWTDMNSPFPPSKRYSHNLAYDSESKVAILFGGMSGGRVNDTWAYKYQPNIPSAPLKLQASLIGGEVHLNWTSPKTDAGSPITEYVIYRGNSADDLTLFKTIQGKDTLEYIDADISKGGTYFYTVRAINAVGESKDSNIIEISIPNGVPGFSLLILSFSLVVYMMFKRK